MKCYKSPLPLRVVSYGKKLQKFAGSLASFKTLGGGANNGKNYQVHLKVQNKFLPKVVIKQRLLQDKMQCDFTKICKVLDIDTQLIWY